MSFPVAALQDAADGASLLGDVQLADPAAPSTGCILYPYDDGGTLEMRVRFANGVVKTLGQSAPAVVFDLDPSTGGIAALSASITIEGSTQNPIARYVASDLASVSSSWPADGYGPTLAAQGSGGQTGLSVPLPNSTDVAFAPKNSRWFLGDLPSDWTLDTWVVEALFWLDENGTTDPISFRNDAGSAYLQIEFTTTGSITILQGDDSGSTATRGLGGNGTLVPGSWNYVAIISDGTNLYAFVNGGTAEVASNPVVAVGTTTIDQVGIGVSLRNEGISDGFVAYAAAYDFGSDITDGDAAATIATLNERFARLTGTYDQAGVAGAPSTVTRASTATLEKWNAATFQTELHTVGPNWIRTGLFNAPDTAKNLLASTDVTTWTKAVSGDTVQASTVETAPDSRYDAYELIANTTDALHAYTGTINTGGSPITRSLYVKPGNKTFISVEQLGDATTRAVYQLSGAGTVESFGGTSAAIEALENGWYRVSHTSGGLDDTLVIYAMDSASDTTIVGDGSTVNLYVAMPQAEVGPLTEFESDTRAYVMAEQGHTNLVIQSEDLSDAAYTALDAGDTFGIGITAPDPKKTSEALIADSTDGDHGHTQSITLTAGRYSVSVYAHAGDRDWVYLSNDSVTNAWAYYNVATGVVGAKGAAVDAANPIDMGGGWFRCVFTHTAVAGANTIRWQSANADNDRDFAGDGAAINTHFFGRHVELIGDPQVNMIRSYVATGSAAAAQAEDRLDYQLSIPGEHAVRTAFAQPFDWADFSGAPGSQLMRQSSGVQLALGNRRFLGLSGPSGISITFSGTPPSTTLGATGSWVDVAARISDTEAQMRARASDQEEEDTDSTITPPVPGSSSVIIGYPGFSNKIAARIGRTRVWPEPITLDEILP